jgi:ABC-type uncharacterized transport system involved in gliding motility auxiliary subunit
MKPTLLILPFLALLVGAIGTAVGSAFPEAPWLTATGWAAAAGLVVFWVILDAKNFKTFFTRKGAKYGAGSGLVVILAMLVIVGIAILSTKPRFNKSFDVTQNKVNTLSEQTEKILENLAKQDKIVKITGLFQDEGVKQQFVDLLAMYTSHKAKFDVEYVDPLRDNLRAASENVTSGNTVILKLGNRESRITTFTEEKLTNALMAVMKEGTKNIWFTRGHGEGQPTGTEANGFSQLAAELEGNQYTVKELSLLEEAKVPDDANLVVIAGPKYDFKAEEGRILEEYLKRGGALLVLADAMVDLPVLNNTLAKFGIEFGNDFLVLDREDPRAVMIGQNNAIVSEFDEFSPVTRDFSRRSQVALLMPNTRTVQEVPGNPHEMKVTLAAKTARMIVKVKNVRSEADLKGLTPDRIEVGNPFPVVAVASGKPSQPAIAKGESPDDAPKADSSAAEDAQKSPETRIVAVGSATFASNTGAQAGENRDFFLNSINWLLQDDDFIAIRPKDPTKSTLTTATGTSQLALKFLTMIYPFIFLGSGLFFWTTRRNA